MTDTVIRTTSLGDLIEALEGLPPDCPVFYDFCDSIPTTVNSYRGYYDQPALGLELSGYGGTAHSDSHTVETLLAELRKALTETYSGWKGGNYRYYKSCTLYVDNPGNCSGTKVNGIQVDDYRVLILTDRDEI